MQAHEVVEWLTKLPPSKCKTITCEVTVAEASCKVGFSDGEEVNDEVADYLWVPLIGEE